MVSPLTPALVSMRVSLVPKEPTRESKTLVCDTLANEKAPCASTPVDWKAWSNGAPSATSVRKVPAASEIEVYADIWRWPEMMPASAEVATVMRAAMLATRKEERKEWESRGIVLKGVRVNRLIAAALGLLEKTVCNQVSTLFDRLGVATRAMAIVTAREHGLGRTGG